MERTLTIEIVDEAVFRALRWLNPSEFRFKREQVGTTIGYEIEDTSGTVLGRYDIRPGREATVDYRMNWFSENLVARESCLKLIELELQALESSLEVNSVGESTTKAEIRGGERVPTNEDHIRAMEALARVREARLIEQLEIISPESARRQPPTLEQFAIWVQEFSATQAQKVQNAYYVSSGSYGSYGSFQVDAVEPIPRPYVVSFSNEHLVVVTFGGEFYRCASYGELRVTMLPNGRLQYRVTGPKTDWENLSRSWKRLYTEMQRHGWVENDEGRMTTEQLAGPAATRQAEPRARGKHMEQYFDDGAPGKEKLVKRFVYPGTIGHFKAFMRRLEKVDLAGGWEASNGVVLAFHDTYSPANEKCGRWTVYPYLWKNDISAWAIIEACEERPDATTVDCFDGYRAVPRFGDLHDCPKIGSIFLEFVNFLEREASAATKPAARAGIPSPTWPNLSNTTRFVPGPAETVTGSEKLATDTQAVFVPKRPADLRRWKTTWKRIRPHVERGETVNELISLRQEKSSPETLEKIIRAGEAGLLS